MDSLNINWAEVADKALSMGQGAVSELIGLIKTVSPEMWEMAIRQVYADAIGDMIVPTMFVVVGVIWGRKIWDKGIAWADSSDGASLFIPVSFSILFIVFAFQFCASITGAAKALINPNYYALLKIAKIAGLGQ